MATSSSRFISTDTEFICAESLSELKRHLEAAHTDSAQWLWTWSALKIALQTFIVAGFGTTARQRAVKGKKKTRLAFLNWRRGFGPYPDEWMRNINDLYKEAKQHAKWPLGDTVDNSVELLIDTRNRLEHYLPGGVWAIEEAVLPEMSADVVKAIRALGWATRETSWHDQDLERRCRGLLSDIENEINLHLERLS